MGNKKRPVEFVKSRTLKPLEERQKFPKKGMYNEHKIKGLFHQWGTDLEEDESGFSECTVAIIEDETGQIHTPIACNVKFLDKQ